MADPPGYPRELERDVVLRERRRDGAVFELIFAPRTAISGPPAPALASA